MKIVVVGGSGRSGAQVVDRLRRLGHAMPAGACRGLAPPVGTAR
jgi:uncharacterized protein YbjT (DUF2867 family)